MDYEVVTVGDTYFDVIFTGLEDDPTLGREVFSQNLSACGGGIFNTAAALSRLSVKVALCTEVGSDPFSQFLLEAYKKEGIDSGLFVKHRGDYKFVTVAFSRSNDRGFLSYAEGGGKRRSSTRFHPDLLARAKGAKLLHLPGVENGVGAMQLAKEAKRGGMTVALDCQETPRTFDDPKLRALLACCDYFMPNEPEALRVSGAADEDEALDKILEFVPNAVIKLGARGAVAKSRGKAKIYAAAMSLGRTIDTTGAGDCFNAGFIYGLLRDYSLENSLIFGNICGGLSVTAIGGATASPTEDGLLKLFNKVKAA